jgi:hypothetical protein
MVNLTDKARELLLSGSLNLTSDTLHFILLGTTYVFDPDAEDVADVVACEISGTGYAGGFEGAGRKLVDNKTFGHGATSHLAFMDCDDVAWTGIDAGTVAAVGVFKLAASDAASLLIGTLDIVHVVTNGNTWTYEVSADGLLTLA